MVCIFAAALLRLSFCRTAYRLVFGAVCAAFVLFSAHWAVLQSKTQIAGWLTQTALLKDLAVGVTIECTLFFIYCVSERQHLRWYPGLLIFPSLFYGQTSLVFALPGVSFAAVKWTLAAVVFAGVPLGAQALNRLCPDAERRTDALLLTTVALCLAGLFTTIN